MENLLPEIALNIFNYISFGVSLKTVALVCKKWLDLLKITKNFKLMTVNLKNISKTTYTLKIIAAKYNIEQLVVSHLGDSIFPLTAILHASPALNTLVIGRLNDDRVYQWLNWQDLVPFSVHRPFSRIEPSIKFSNISRLVVSYRYIALLHLFPNVKQLKVDHIDDLLSGVSSPLGFGPFSSITEIETGLDLCEDLDFSILKKVFPNLATLYLIYQPRPRYEETDWKEIENKCKDIDVTVHCRNFMSFGRSLKHQFTERTYAEYFYNHGETPLLFMLKRRVISLEIEEFLQRHSFLTAEYEADFASRDRQVVFPSNSDTYETDQVTPPPLLQNLPAEIQATLKKYNIIPPLMLRNETPKTANDSVKPNEISIPKQQSTSTTIEISKKGNLTDVRLEDDDAEKFWKKFREGLTSLLPRTLLDHVVNIKDYPIRNFHDMQTFAKFLFQMSMKQSTFLEVVSVIGVETFAKLINTTTSYGTPVHYLIGQGLPVIWDLMADYIDWSIQDGSGCSYSTFAFKLCNYELSTKFNQYGAPFQIEQVFSLSYVDYFNYQPQFVESVSNADLKKWIFSYIIKEIITEHTKCLLCSIIDLLELSKQEILTFMNMHLLAKQFTLIAHLQYKYNIDISDRDNNNEKMLQIALNSRNFQLVSFALSLTVNAKLEIANGMSPLIYLCNMQHTTDQDIIFFHLVLDALVFVGANVNEVYQNEQGEQLTAIEVARRAGNPTESIEYYINKATLEER